MANASKSQELEALELARCRLEAVLGEDENWRALRQSGAGDTDPAGSAARQARDTRLEMALAGNAHYQAWKHLNGAIEALRARNAAQASLKEEAASVSPVQPGAVSGAARVASAGASAQRLADRLGQLEGPDLEATALSPEAWQGPAAKDRRGPALGVHPPEASVTFVVREIGSAPADELPPDPGGRPRPASILGPGAEVPDRPSVTGADLAATGEAEVTIITAEGRRQLREAAEAASHVRRFRKALSGD